MPYTAARSSRHVESQIREPWSTASGFTVLTRIPAAPPSSARHRARCSSAAFADEYAAAFLPATSAFFDATHPPPPPSRPPPRPPPARRPPPTPPPPPAPRGAGARGTRTPPRPTRK